MKDKIFQKLKQAYSSLGLGDEVLTLHAESLAGLGLVTDDNIDTVVNAQRSFLEGLQRNADKRVTDATRKATEELTKKHEEELKKKAEDDAKKAAEEAARKAKEEADKKAAEDAKKAAEDAAKRAAEEADRKAKEEANRKSAEEAVRKRQEELDNLRASIENSSTAALTAMQKKFEEQMQQMLNANKATADSLKATEEKLAQANKSLDDMAKERDQIKAEQAAAKRSAFILSKAKELGIPQSRIDEGFAIASDADDNAITDHLTKVSNNIKVMGLPNRSNHFAMTGKTQPDEVEVKDIAKQLVN